MSSQLHGKFMPSTGSDSIKIILIATLLTLSSITAQASEGVKLQLANYEDYYPEVNFIHLDGLSGFKYLNSLPMRLGIGASNVDYEHRPNARELLIETQMGRIEMMLEERMPSATLFLTGENSAFTQPYVCVITLDDTVLLSDPLAATRFITGTKASENLPYQTSLDNGSFLLFTVDHEVFHCLDAYLNGPTRPMTRSQITASHSEFRAEQRADFYAALMHKSRPGSPDNFLRDVASFRTLSFNNWDITHYTAPILRRAISIDHSRIVHLDIEGLLSLSMHEADQFIMTRELYLRFLVSAVHAANILNIAEVSSSQVVSEIMQLKYKPDERLVSQIREDVILAQRAVSGL